MNEEQAFSAIRNAIHLETLGRETAGKVTKELIAIFKQVDELINQLGRQGLARDMNYRRVLRQITPLFRGVNERFYADLSDALRKEAEEQLYYAEKFLRIGERQPSLSSQGLTLDATPEMPVSTRAVSGGYAGTMNAVQPLQIPGNFQLGTQITRTQLMALVDDTEVLGKRLNELFEWDLENGSPYTAAQVKKIDRIVKQGFLTGETNEQIARNLVMAQNGAIRDSRAIARTAVMDMSQRAHERFWDANSDVVKLWEYDATMDYRVCPQCYPHDGKRRQDRSDLPKVPVHPNCRCRVLPLTQTALNLEKEDLKEGMTVSTVQIGDPVKGGKVRRYKTKARFDGRKVSRFAQEITTERGERPTMGFFLLRANNETRKAVLGKANADRFYEMVRGTEGSKAKLAADDALREIIKNPLRKRRRTRA